MRSAHRTPRAVALLVHSKQQDQPGVRKAEVTRADPEKSQNHRANTLQELFLSSKAQQLVLAGPSYRTVESFVQTELVAPLFHTQASDSLTAVIDSDPNRRG